MSIQTSVFLTAVLPAPFPDGAFLELRIDTGAEIVRLWDTTPAGIINQAKQYHATAKSIWFGPGLRRTQRGRDEDVGWLQSLWVDCDAKCFPNQTQEEALEKLQTFDPAPSVIVDTGHGMQGYWVLEAPAEGPQVAEAKSAMHWLRDQLSTGLPHALDSVHNPSRMMRLPNTWNRKEDTPAMCRVLIAEPARRYFLALFGRFSGEDSSELPPWPETAFPSPHRLSHAEKLALRGKAFLSEHMEQYVWDRLTMPDSSSNHDTSSLDWSTSIVLLKSGLTMQEVENLWMSTELGSRAKTQERVKYRRETIWKAFNEIKKSSEKKGAVV